MSEVHRPKPVEYVSSFSARCECGRWLTKVVRWKKDFDGQQRVSGEHWRHI